MNNIEVILESDGLKELMKSQEVISFMESQANEIVGRCSGSYEVDNWSKGRTRANVSIKTSDKKTFFKNLKDNELLKALGGSK